MYDSWVADGRRRPVEYPKRCRSSFPVMFGERECVNEGGVWERRWPSSSYTVDVAALLIVTKPSLSGVCDSWRDATRGIGGSIGGLKETGELEV